MSELQTKKKKKKKDKVYVDPFTPPPSPDTFPPYVPRDYFHFELIHQSKKSNARVGRIHTPHGIIDTPGFVPVATAAALKAVDVREMDQLADQQLMFCNTYHLLLQPGPEIVEEAGGLHRFMGREPTRPLITDSGGFQVFSLAYGSVHDELNIKGGQSGRNHAPTVVGTSEEGVTFRSYRDGARILLTPESTVAAQKAIGADIIIPLDELPPYHITPERLRQSVYLSHRWEARSLRAHLADPRRQAMYAVIHGGSDRALRQQSIDYLSSLPFDGFAVGGSMGRLGDELVDLVGFVSPQLPAARPRHLLGIGDVRSVARCVAHGIDTFDSAFPSRNGRHGTLLTAAGAADGAGGAGDGHIKIRNSRYAHMHEPISPYLPHTAAYLHHLVKASEPVAAALFTRHNLCFMQDFMRDLRRRILADEI